VTLRSLRQSRAETRNSSMSSYPNGWGWNDPAAIPPPGMFTMNRAGVPVTPHTSLQVDVVHTSLRVLSNAIIKMGNPVAYKTAYDKQNRPYKQWLNPQPGILTSTFGNLFQYDGRRRTVISMALFGEAFWYTLSRDYLGFPTAIEVLSPVFVTIEQGPNGPLYFYGTGAKKVQLATEDVTHIPFMSMPGAMRGLSSIEYAGVSYALALAAMEYGQRWFSQGASPSFILQTDNKLGTEEVERIARRFLIEHSGLQSSHLPLVLDSGLKAQKISSTPDEAQYLNTLEYARTCIAAWFGLPQHLVGGANDKGNVWGKTVQEQGFQMVDFTLSGYTVPLAEAHGRLLPRGTDATFNEQAILRANAEDQAKKVMADRTATVRTPNEIRVDDYGLPPIPGGDDIAAPLASNTVPGATEPMSGQSEIVPDDGGGDS
jgi:HK97 family phage portal protein